jgi:hypothetical protein
MFAPRKPTSFFFYELFLPGECLTEKELLFFTSLLSFFHLHSCHKNHQEGFKNTNIHLISVTVTQYAIQKQEITKIRNDVSLAEQKIISFADYTNFIDLNCHQHKPASCGWSFPAFIRHTLP